MKSCSLVDLLPPQSGKVESARVPGAGAHRGGERAGTWGMELGGSIPWWL
jgi:hypothetical protein